VEEKMSDQIDCPDCGRALAIDEALEEGQELECDYCGVKLEVTQTDPISVKVLRSTGTCPDCNQPLDVEEALEVGEIIECDSCGAELEVLQLDPLQVALIEEEK
jgi:alpha-aminoadipate carrier protein LysW